MVRRRNTRSSTSRSRTSSTRSTNAHKVAHSKDTRTGTKKVHSRTVNAPKSW